VFNKYWQRLALLSFGHGLNDFAAGYMLGNMLYLHTGIRDVAIGFLIYNVLAFGGQYFAARFLEKFSNLKLIITACALFNLAAVSLFQWIPQLSLVLAGCASAVYHVAGGSACLKENKAAPIGAFAAPGIVGLSLAGYLSYLKIDIWLMLSIVCIVFVGMVQFIQFPALRKNDKVEEENDHRGFDNHDVLMILLLGIISLRSAIWNIFQIIHEHNYTWLLAIAASAFIGKILGGWISDKIGWKLYSFVSLIAAMPLVSFFKEEIVLFCIGIGLLQSAIPANTAMMIEYCKGRKERGIAFSFGTAIVIGIIFTSPVQFFSINGTVYWLLFSLLLFTLLIMKRKLLFRSLVS
jgi:FSR family fosmidomycin resistance protein-like MFS transporter